MFLVKFLKERLKEIATGQMPPLSRAQRKRGFQYSPWQRFHADEDGKISLVSVFTVLAMIMFIGLIMNTTVSVKEKVEMQNAADVAAYTTNLWRARAMNAITTINHVFGEQTALLTLLDGFGGELLGQDEISVDESVKANNVLKKLYSASDPVSPPISGQSKIGNILRPIDIKVVEACYQRMTDDKGRHKAGAAIYDSKMQLKQLTEKVFVLKIAVNPLVVVAGVLENTGFPVTVAVGYLLDAGCAALHVELSKELVELTKERVIIDIAESLLANIDKKILKTSMQEIAFPALTLYADSIVGSMKGNASASLVSKSIQESLTSIQTENSLTKITLDPAVEKLQLPIIAESPPVLKSSKTDSSKRADLGPWEIPGAGWNGNFRKKLESEKVLKQLLAPLEQLAEKIKPLISAFEELDRVVGQVKNRIPFPDEPKDLKKAWDKLDELKSIPGSVSGLTNQLSNILEADRNDGFEGNPSRAVDAYKIQEFYWQAEMHSQWVRATYPYVDDYRSGWLHLMKDHLSRSNIATYYAKWTNRYTLANSFEMRKVDDNRTGKKESTVLDELRKKVRGWRQRFENALDSSDEEAAGTLGIAPFEEISDQFHEFVSNIPLPPEFENWKQRVIKHKSDAIQRGRSLSAGPDDDISDENIKELGTQIARINLLDELLTLLEDLLDALEIKRPHMYVMKFMDGKNKGLEPWTSDGKLAEQLFCIRASVARNGQRIFMSPVFFSQHLVGERISVSQSMLYNANGRTIQNKTDSRFQVDTGWDTLNWESPVQAFEWGKHEPSVDSVSATDIFISGRAIRRVAKSKINWQSKLTPIPTIIFSSSSPYKH